ncbi:TetR/AcrR family transcriptional regulator [Streptomyces sp. NPDC004436]
METENPLRERLVDVGVELVTFDGPAALGLREIARRAGVSHGAPRRYFPTHRSLLSAIARRGFTELEERFTAATTGAPGAAPAQAPAPPPAPEELVRAIGRAYVGYAVERPGMFELMFRHDLLDGSDDPAPQGTRLRESTLPWFDLLVTLVARCGAADPAVTAAALWAGLHGVAQLWCRGSLPLALRDDPAVGPDRLVDAVVDAHLGAAGRGSLPR